MKKTLLLLSASLALVADAGTNLSLELANRIAIEKLETAGKISRIPGKPAAGQTSLSVVVDFRTAEALEAAVADGLTPASRFGTRVFVTLPLDRIEALSARDDIRRISLTGRKHLLNNNSRSASFVNEVQEGTELPEGYTGEGVIVGLYDGGLDPSHINFKDSEGESRVGKVWCFPLYNGWEEDAMNGVLPEDPDKDVNVYSTPEEIKRFTTDDRTESHGTHVLGTAAGAYAISATRDYRGMAPGSDLAIACGRFDDLSILRGVDSVATYAESVGKPCAINLSLGSNSGPHDGSDDFTAILNEIAGRDLVTVCVAAGNEGSDNISLVKTFTEANPTLRTFATSNYGSASIAGSFEIWSEDDTPIEVELQILNTSHVDDPIVSYPMVDGMSKYLVTADLAGRFSADAELMEAFGTCFTASRMGGSLGVDPANNRYGAIIDLDLNSSVGGHFFAVKVTGQPGKKVFLYSPSTDYMVFDSKNKAGFDKPDGNGSINTIACGPNTIAVGAYSGRGNNGNIAYFSSWSDMYDGSTLPHIAAPGVDVVSSMNKYYYASHSWDVSAECKVNGVSYYWTTKSGTSMATPAMTGIAALWLSANPDLTSEDIREIAMATATAPSVMATYWGAGKVNAYEGVKRIVGSTALAGVKADDGSSILVAQLSPRVYEICAPADGDNLSVEVFDLQGRRVVLLPVVSGSAVADLSGLPASTYIVKATTPRNTRTFKLR